jgi:ferredoxin
MKKGIIVLLIAVLVSGFAFAGLKGTATFSAGYDLDGKKFTIDNAKTGSATFTFEFEAQSGATAEVESGIYAEFSGSLSATIVDGAFKTKLDLKDAYIKSVDGLWSVNLTKVAHGVEITYADYALDVFYASKLNWGASIATPKYEVMEGLTISAKAGYKQDKKDLTNAADYGWVLKSDYQDEIDELYYSEDYFKTHDDGTYYNEDLKDAQDEVKAKAEALADAEEAFAADPTGANYDAITAAKKALTTAEKALKTAVSDLEAAFWKDNKDEDWVTETKKTTHSIRWDAIATGSTPLQPNEGEVIATGYPVGLAAAAADYTEYFVKSGDSYTHMKSTAYNDYAKAHPAAEVAYSIKVPAEESTGEVGTGRTVYLFVGDAVTRTYAKAAYGDKGKAALFEFSTPDLGTQTVFGGIEVAYAADKLTASLAFNGKYEMLTYKKFAFDVTAKAAYDFVNGEVSFERTLEAENVLGAKAGAKLDDVIGMPLSVEVACSDILNKTEAGRILSGKASFEVAGLKLGAGATMTFANKPAKTQKGRIVANGSVEYGFEFATIKAEVKGYKEYFLDDAGDYTVAKIAVDPSLTVTNTSLIQNATLSLAWAGAHFGGDAAKKALGTITASVGIKF